MTALRFVDDTLRKARENLAVTEALLRRLGEGRSPETFRAQRFPRSAIVGRHQILRREVDVDWCAAQSVEVARRMTGGGAIVMGLGCLGWELVVSRSRVPRALDEVTRVICGAVAAALRGFGAAAAFRPRNDVEVDGRKVSGAGGYFDGGRLVFQGTVLIALDRALLTRALRLPAHKLGPRGLAALADRVTDLRTLGLQVEESDVAAALASSIASALDMRLAQADLTPDEQADAIAVHDAEIGTDAFVHGADDAFGEDRAPLAASVATPGGAIDVAIRLRPGEGRRIDQAMITGDFFTTSPRVVPDLEAHLRDCALDDAAAAAARFLAAAPPLSVPAEAIVAAIAKAAA